LPLLPYLNSEGDIYVGGERPPGGCRPPRIRTRRGVTSTS